MRAFVLAGLAAATLTACSGGAPPATLPARDGAGASSQPNGGVTPLVYVSDEAKNLIAVFDRDGKRVATIRNGLDYPQGLFVDAAHNLWVANRGAADVLEFARGASVPVKVLGDPGSQPEGVTMCPDGTVYVANIVVTGGGDVVAYAPGKTKPTRTLSYEGGNFFYPACDRNGNLFATLVLGSNGTVVEFPHGRQAGASVLPIFMGGNPGGIAIDRAGNLLVDDPGGNDAITEYTESGTPTGVVLHTKHPWNEIALDRRGATLFGATAHGGASLAFPDGAPRRSYTGKEFAQPIGIAVDPGI